MAFKAFSIAASRSSSLMLASLEGSGPLLRCVMDDNGILVGDCCIVGDTNAFVLAAAEKATINNDVIDLTMVLLLVFIC